MEIWAFIIFQLKVYKLIQAVIYFLVLSYSCPPYEAITITEYMSEKSWQQKNLWENKLQSLSSNVILLT